VFGKLGIIPQDQLDEHIVIGVTNYEEVVSEEEGIPCRGQDLTLKNKRRNNWRRKRSREESGERSGRKILIRS
jgi:hypothetical protein